MMRTRVKICGFTRVDDAIYAAKAGVDAIGLVFYPPSPRNVDINQAIKIVNALPAFVSVVALFVDEQHAALEIEVGAAQRHRLRGPHSGPKQQMDEGVIHRVRTLDVAALFGSLAKRMPCKPPEDRVPLRRCEGPRIGRRPVWPLQALEGVAADDLVRLGVAQHRLQAAGENVAHELHGQALPEQVLLDAAEINQLEVRDRHVANHWQHVFGEVTFIVVQQCLATRHARDPTLIVSADRFAATLRIVPPAAPEDDIDLLKRAPSAHRFPDSLGKERTGEPVLCRVVEAECARHVPRHAVDRRPEAQTQTAFMPLD